ncbi:hypothetical protein HYH03_009699 [Edaphochlamys debaryana]|uniref:Peptidase M50 domain-containing protein n=1 Tax=Edaphochlamys debaryana TaxID=47281 RepID=A0A836BY64_9CHLO|nr:hypothetical protein HYH03_009699 [Edaphochlamys debaryana]|eukprot:KAG2491968.1 hypothetical protein HYH03_009699 [Edaphochlamys debaryana]
MQSEANLALRLLSGLRGARTASFGFSVSAAAKLSAAVVGLGYICGGTEPGGVATALSAAALLNGALLAHEAGHLAAARALGVAVREFSVGVGPSVAWWTGAQGTTYRLRALPLFGYVSFLTGANLAEAGPGALRGAGGRPLRLLEALSPGRRALVMAAGVAGNIAVAAAFVAYQVWGYGELTAVVRPGARVRLADGFDAGPGGPEGSLEAEVAAAARRASGAAAGSQRLCAGDVLLAVGDQVLPAGGDADMQLVKAMEAAAAANGGPVEGGVEAAAALAGVRLTVLRQAGGAEAAVSTAPMRAEVLSLEASDLFRYEALSLGPNRTPGYRPPEGLGEALAMTGRELSSWSQGVLSGWADAMAAGISFASGSPSTSSSSSTTPATDSNHLVGPLGLVACAAAAAVAADRESHAHTTYHATSSSSATTSGAASTAAAEAVAAYGKDVRQGRPPVLLDLGIQLNLQLAALNLLPLPVLDGGQLLLVALEAIRGGRRLPPHVERAALVLSGLAVAGWTLALSAADVVGLASKAASGVATVLAPGQQVQVQVSMSAPARGSLGLVTAEPGAFAT